MEGSVPQLKCEDVITAKKIDILLKNKCRRQLYLQDPLFS
jgi:hypothetical protein